MTVKQRQGLLIYLGYNLAADGVDGPRTQAAMADIKKRYGVGEDGLVGIIAKTVAPLAGKDSNVPASQGDWWNDIKHFTRAEYACPCGRCGGFPVEPKEKLVRAEDKVREHFGRPAHNSSGVRCVAHNNELPGSAANSRHLTGCAVDFSVEGVSAASLDAYVGSLPEVAYHYRIKSDGKDTGYVHMDVVI